MEKLVFPDDTAMAALVVAVNSGSILKASNTIWIEHCTAFD